MSKRNRKYWAVTNTQIISANTKTEAIHKANRKRGIDADVLGNSMSASQLYAAEAKQTVEALSGKVE